MKRISESPRNGFIEKKKIDEYIHILHSYKIKEMEYTIHTHSDLDTKFIL